jgi:quercetin dioxygenase-like cupin family protein
MRKMKASMGILVTALVGVGTLAGFVWAAPPAPTSALIGRADFGPFKVNRHGSDDLGRPWEVVVEAMRGLTIATQTITFAPGAQSTWHTHPGPVFISVKEGTMTFYEEDCTATVRTAGEGFVDVGAHPHLARNESNATAINVVTYFAPPNTTVLRHDEAQPPNCSL